MSTVAITDAVKKYDAVAALDGVTMTFQEGEFFGLLGPSGSGKTTLLRAIAGFVTLDRGQVLIDGQDVGGVPVHARNIGMMFQNYALFPHLNVEKNVGFGLRQEKLPRAEIAERVDAMLALVRLQEYRKRRIDQLSGGQKQRVALARALSTEPEVLLMDEPFAALDAQTRDLLHDELERIWAETGRTIVFVTHNVREAVRLGDRVVLLTYRPGRVKKEFLVDLPRPRQLEEVEVAHAARQILDELREEINKSLEAEYRHEKAN